MATSVTWTVVEFIDSFTVEAVPTHWLLGKQCYWPPIARDRLQNEIKKNGLPDPCWPLYDVRVFKDATYDTYLVARSKAKRAEDTSDLNSDYEKRKSIPVRRILSSSESELDVKNEKRLSISVPKLKPNPNRVCKYQDEPTQQDFNKTKYGFNTRDDSESSKGDEYNVMTKERQLDDLKKMKKNQYDIGSSTSTLSSVTDGKSEQAESICKGCTCPIFQKTTEAYLKEILRKQFLIKAHVIQLAEDLSTLMQLNKNKENKQEVTSFLVKFNFPLNTESEVEDFEYLKNEKNFKETVQEMAKFGGHNNNEFIRRCLSQIMTNELAEKYSFYGAKKKRVFKSLKLWTVLKDAAVLHNNDTDYANLEEAVKKWLRRAKERAAYKSVKSCT